MARERTAMRRPRGLAVFALALTIGGAAWPQGAPPDDRPLTPEEFRELIDRVIANQHRDDAALEEYERVERRQIRRHEKDTSLSEDNTFRVLPTGAGVARIEIESYGRAVDPALYRRQLQTLEQTLAVDLSPGGQARQRQAAEKYAKKTQDREEMINALRDAYRLTWLGREKYNGRVLAKIHFEPNPDYKPTSRNTSLFANVRATVWVDEAAAQLARLDAEIFRDISFGGGVVGKVYRGGRFILEQTEVAPGIWLPTLYDSNLSGRKFLFSAELHQRIHVNRYRRVGRAKEVLAALRHELSSGTPARSDP
ncbi:MAG TPA: hypothetical protein VKE24_15300 [Candidatus Acidoferrales bacterium]|nr:hypothetical protein [Candidatus Acidoferrales bacterium]